VLATIDDFQNLSLSSQRLAQFQVVADGVLFRLPGGDVRLAVGAETPLPETSSSSCAAAREAQRRRFPTHRRRAARTPSSPRC